MVEEKRPCSTAPTCAGTCEPCGVEIAIPAEMPIDPAMLTRCAKAMLKPIEDAILTEDELWGLIPSEERAKMRNVVKRVIIASGLLQRVETLVGLLREVPLGAIPPKSGLRERIEQALQGGDGNE
jgi:hypothetical protein